MADSIEDARRDLLRGIADAWGVAEYNEDGPRARAAITTFEAPVRAKALAAAQALVEAARDVAEWNAEARVDALRAALAPIQGGDR